MGVSRAEMVKQTLGRAIQLADQVAKALDRALVRSKDKSFIPDLKSNAEQLAGLLRQLSSIDLDTYDRLVCAIIDSVEQSLDRCLFRLLKHHCPKWIIIKIIKKRFPTLIPIVSFRKTSRLLDDSINDLSWLIHFWRNKTNGRFELSLPLMKSNNRMLCLVWEEIAILHDPAQSYQARSSAAASLGEMARYLDAYRKLIIRECGVEALLKLMEEGPMEAKQSAANALGFVVWSSECVGISVDVCKVFAKILSEGFMKVQAEVAFAVSLIAERNPKWQDAFAEHDVVRLLVGHLAFETVGVQSSKTHKAEGLSSLPMSPANPLLFTIFCFLCTLFPAFQGAPIPDPAPSPVQSSFLRTRTPYPPAATIPAFPEQSDIAGCPLHLPNETCDVVYCYYKIAPF